MVHVILSVLSKGSQKVHCVYLTNTKLLFSDVMDSSNKIVFVFFN